MLRRDFIKFIGAGAALPAVAKAEDLVRVEGVEKRIELLQPAEVITSLRGSGNLHCNLLVSYTESLGGYKGITQSSLSAEIELEDSEGAPLASYSNDQKGNPFDGVSTVTFSYHLLKGHVYRLTSWEISARYGEFVRAKITGTRIA